MFSQVVYFWIILCIYAGPLYSEDTEFMRKGNKSDGGIIDSTNFRDRVIGNETDSTESAAAKNFTSTEATINNETFTEAMSPFTDFEDDRNVTQTSPFISDGSTTVTTEQPPTEGSANTTFVANSEVLETNGTRSVTELSTGASPKTTEGQDECTPDNCTSTNDCTFTKPSGCIRLREDSTEEAFTYRIMLPDASNLIFVEMEPEMENLFPDSNINFTFEGCGTRKETWEMKEGEKIRKRIYISKESSLTLRISTDKSWINFILRYKELAFEAKEDRVKDTVDKGSLDPPMVAGLRYRPSTQVTYLLTASKSRWNESSVMMTLTFVDLDEGDYLLIGAGKNPFAGPKPFFITGRVSKSRKYYIASDDVYVRFVSGASQKVDKRGFHIKWERSGTAITKPDEKPEEETVPDFIIQSVGICFYNVSLLAEFNTTENYKGPLQNFREKLANVANIYAKQNTIRLESTVTASSVEIFRVSSVLEPIENVMPDGGLYVMVSIVHQFDRKTAVFRRPQLEEIIELLDKKNMESQYSLLGFRAGHCPSVDTNLEWYIAAVLLILISTIALIAVWICTSVSKWRGFAQSKKSSGPLENVYCQEPQFHVQENDYIRYTPGINKPQMKLTTSDGDTMTLDDESLNQSSLEKDDGPDRVLYHQEWIMKQQPSSSEIPRRVTATVEVERRRPLLETFAVPIPSTKKKNTGRLWMDIPMNSLLPQDGTQSVDHEYDSLIFPIASSSSSTTCLVKDDGETKL